MPGISETASTISFLFCCLLSVLSLQVSIDRIIGGGCAGTGGVRRVRSRQRQYQLRHHMSSVQIQRRRRNLPVVSPELRHLTRLHWVPALYGTRLTPRPWWMHRVRRSTARPPGRHRHHGVPQQNAAQLRERLLLFRSRNIHSVQLDAKIRKAESGDYFHIFGTFAHFYLSAVLMFRTSSQTSLVHTIELRTLLDSFTLH